MVLGKRNADHLDAPDSKLFQAAVLATAVVTFAAETVRRVIPGATRLSEQFGHRAQRVMLTNAMHTHRGDRGFRRHDNLPAPEQTRVA